jgi:hypothetical protein
MWMARVPVSPMALGARGETVPEDFGDCPCGEQAVSGQTWITEWYDRTGLVDRCVVVRLCGVHRARRPGEN